MPVVVQVGGGDIGRVYVSCVVDRSAERALAVAEEDRDAVAVGEAVPADGDVEFAVVVEVCDREATGRRANGVSLLRREAALPVAQSHRDRVLVGVRND